MKISYRLKEEEGKGNWEQGENKSKSHCDRCGHKLWMGPTGIYCDNEHPKK